MSLRVLVIPEDPTHNGYILRPLVERMFREVGRPNARVTVLPNPRIQGYAQAVAALRGELLVRYRHWDLWLFLPDADQPANFIDLEQTVARNGIPLICCAAVPEIEAWLLAGHRDKLGISWAMVRAHLRLKEEVFAPFLRVHGDLRAVGGGREWLMQDTLGNYRGLLDVCPELKRLEERLRKWVLLKTAT